MVSPGYVKTDLSKNALTATGETHDRMDQATQQGSVKTNTFCQCCGARVGAVIFCLDPEPTLFVRNQSRLRDLGLSEPVPEPPKKCRLRKNAFCLMQIVRVQLLFVFMPLYYQVLFL